MVTSVVIAQTINKKSVWGLSPQAPDNTWSRHHSRQGPHSRGDKFSVESDFVWSSGAIRAHGPDIILESTLMKMVYF